MFKKNKERKNFLNLYKNFLRNKTRIEIKKSNVIKVENYKIFSFYLKYKNYYVKNQKKKCYKKLYFKNYCDRKYFKFFRKTEAKNLHEKCIAFELKYIDFF